MPSSRSERGLSESNLLKRPQRAHLQERAESDATMTALTLLRRAQQTPRLRLTSRPHRALNTSLKASEEADLSVRERIANFRPPVPVEEKHDRLWLTYKPPYAADKRAVPLHVPKTLRLKDYIDFCRARRKAFESLAVPEGQSILAQIAFIIYMIVIVTFVLPPYSEWLPADGSQPLALFDRDMLDTVAVGLVFYWLWYTALQRMPLLIGALAISARLRADNKASLVEKATEHRIRQQKRARLATSQNRDPWKYTKQQFGIF